MAVEETIIMPARLPEGQDWAWHPDLNIIEVSDRLDEAGIMVALCDLQAQWRRSMVKILPGPRPARRTGPPSFALLHNEVETTRSVTHPKAT